MRHSKDGTNTTAAAGGSPISTAVQGLPFSVAGTGDLLALFRCVSCRYKFSIEASKPASMVRPMPS